MGKAELKDVCEVEGVRLGLTVPERALVLQNFARLYQSLNDREKTFLGTVLKQMDKEGLFSLFVPPAPKKQPTLSEIETSIDLLLKNRGPNNGTAKNY